MKIEKINDNQIKCTLNKSDLASRQIKLSELAYGTEKAKSLFRDMMQQASMEFGFEAEDIPLMIEAIPAATSPFPRIAILSLCSMLKERRRDHDRQEKENNGADFIAHLHPEAGRARLQALCR